MGEGGEMFTKVADLAIPFGLLFAMRAFKKTTDKKKAAPPKKVVPKKVASPRTKKGGACSVCSQSQMGGTQQVIREEIMKITQDLKALLSM